MVPIRDQSGAPYLSAYFHTVLGDDLIDNESNGSYGHGQRDVGWFIAFQQFVYGLVPDQVGGGGNEYDNYDARHILSAVIPIGELGSGLFATQGEGDPQRQRGCQVTQAVDRVGEEAGTTADKGDGTFNHTNQEECHKSDLDHPEAALRIQQFLVSVEVHFTLRLECPPCEPLGQMHLHDHQVSGIAVRVLCVVMQDSDLGESNELRSVDGLGFFFHHSFEYKAFKASLVGYSLELPHQHCAKAAVSTIGVNHNSEFSHVPVSPCPVPVQGAVGDDPVILPRPGGAGPCRSPAPWPIVRLPWER